MPNAPPAFPTLKIRHPDDDSDQFDPYCLPAGLPPPPSLQLPSFQLENTGEWRQIANGPYQGFVGFIAAQLDYTLLLIDQTGHFAHTVNSSDTIFNFRPFATPTVTVPTQKVMQQYLNFDKEVQRVFAAARQDKLRRLASIEQLADLVEKAAAIIKQNFKGSMVDIQTQVATNLRKHLTQPPAPQEQPPQKRQKGTSHGIKLNKTTPLPNQRNS